MKLRVKPRTATEVNAKVLKLHLKVCDNFSASIIDANGVVLRTKDDGYVPGFMPGEHYGDYVILDIDMDTGAILNWRIDPARVKEWIEGDEE